jgi:hypothetical protein
MKTIGILDGLGPISISDYYKAIISTFNTEYPNSVSPFETPQRFTAKASWITVSTTQYFNTILCPTIMAKTLCFTVMSYVNIVIQSAY